MQTTSQQNSSSNEGYVNSNIIQFRLDTNEIIDKAKMYLSGEILIPQRQADGSTVLIKQSIGEPLANKIGSQLILSKLSMLINPAVVQGNYTFDQYQNHVSRIHKSISRQLVCNYPFWGIKYDNLENISDDLMHLIESFLSRLIDNKERESYAQTLRSQESSRVDAGSKLGGLFGGAKQ